MATEKITVKCMGGPMDGRQVSVNPVARFISVPHLVGVWMDRETGETFGPAFGDVRYERIGSLAFFVDESTP